MRIPKKYGDSFADLCPFCSNTGTTKNSQGIPVCPQHKNELLKDIKCVCGEYLDIKEGRFGVYFYCINCGNKSFRKVMDS
ncbi:MAG TPA: hypothetical protein VJH97_05560 [Candidatus Nanoarchaeia archaeon]|nr:hypothetical protein [Candidatus Nanoarchaeia archaeon]